MEKSNITAKEVDERFNNGDELEEFFTEELDPETYAPKKKKISAELPINMVVKIDAIVAQTGNTRNAVIRMLLDKSLRSGSEENYLKKVLAKLAEK